MRCPECSNKQKATAGKTCRKCGYVFALDPKEPPHLTDRQMKKVIENLTGSGGYFFTFNQLYAALYRMVSKKRSKKRIPVAVVLVVLTIIAFFAAREASLWAAVALVVAAAAGIGWFLRRRVVPAHEPLVQAINRYRQFHPVTNLVDGTKFKREASKETLKQELFNYAPERILVCQHDDMVDMLVLNRFHFENKTAVIGASKYPIHVFAACQKFLEKRPDLPVEILHDASLEGCKLKDRILEDASWNLRDKNVKDLGLSLEDAANIKSPIWIPSQRMSGSHSKDPVEGQIQRGMKMPVDFAAPGVFLGALAFAAAAGFALMSTELLAEQAKKKDTGGGYG